MKKSLKIYLNVYRHKVRKYFPLIDLSMKFFVFNSMGVLLISNIHAYNSPKDCIPHNFRINAKSLYSISSSD